MLLTAQSLSLRWMIDKVVYHPHRYAHQEGDVRTEQFSERVEYCELWGATEQVISKDKYATIFSPQMETIVSIILQISFAICAVWKIGKYPSDIPQFLLGNIQPRNAFKFRPITSDGRSLMDSNLRKLDCQSRYILILGIFGPKTFAYGSCARTMSGSQNLVV